MDDDIASLPEVIEVAEPHGTLIIVNGAHSEGQARIRVMNSASHSREDLDRGLDAFQTVGDELGVI